ncbi:MAG: hypothetical protein E4H01_08750 [Lysobacterales bacterium]|nr:MAG: hypothetical protein E4H01_08750 [Xanthomonadales bacterium]
MRRGIGVYLPPASDLMRPMPVYGISEWDHNYVKLTSRARELNLKAQSGQNQITEGQKLAAQAGIESAVLNQFVQTWTNPYGAEHGMVIRHTPGTGLGSGVTHVDTRPIGRPMIEAPHKPILDAMTSAHDLQDAHEKLVRLGRQGETPQETLNRILDDYQEVAADPV